MEYLPFDADAQQADTIGKRPAHSVESLLVVRAVRLRLVYRAGLGSLDDANDLDGPMVGEFATYVPGRTRGTYYLCE
jgi:hypothetical protein